MKFIKIGNTYFPLKGINKIADNGDGTVTLYVSFEHNKITNKFIIDRDTLFNAISKLNSSPKDTYIEV